MAQVYIVTGATSGIGLALSKRLLQDGNYVCACGRNAAKLQQQFNESIVKASIEGTNNKAQLMLQRLDVRQPEQWQNVVANVLEKWQRIDVLCNVAGVLKENWVADIVVPEEVDLHFDVNTKGAIYGTQSVIAPMRQQGSGHIINIASIAALTPVTGLSLYSASKYALRAYSLAAGMELAEYGIAVTSLCPDAVQTPMLDQQKDKEQAALTFSGNRTLSVDEVVAAILGPVRRKRPLEIVLPTSRGVVAKFANVFPQTMGRFIGIFRKQGLKRQAKS